MYFLCVSNRGTSNANEQSFREAYGKIGHLKSFIRAPFMCLTATASNKMRSKITKLLHLTNTKFIRLSPDKQNLKFGEELEETFGGLLREFDGGKTIIYCRSLKDCGESYSLFNDEWDDLRVAMYHSKTPENIKERVLKSFLEVGGQCRLVIATSALGMGVNIPDVRHVVHYGVSSDLESYRQEVGRGGRDGKACTTTLFYRPYHLAHCNESMRNFIKNPNNLCRRKLLMKYFKDKPNPPDLQHDCCDVCHATCECGNSCKETPSSIPYEEEQLPALSRNVSDSERLFLREMLSERPAGMCSSIFGSGTLSGKLHADTVKAIVSKCEYIFSVDFVMDNFPVFSRKLAVEILAVINDIFNDRGCTVYCHI